MIPLIAVFITVIISSHSEWESLLERLEELGEGNGEAITAAVEMLKREAIILDMPLPPTALNEKDIPINTDKESISGIHLLNDMINDHLEGNYHLDDVDINMRLKYLDEEELNFVTSNGVVDLSRLSESDVDLTGVIRSENFMEILPQENLVGEGGIDLKKIRDDILSQIDFTDLDFLSNNLQIDISALIDRTGSELSDDTLRSIEDTAREAIQREFNLNDDILDSAEALFDDDRTDEELGIKSGEGELHFGSDTLRFEWLMANEEWDTLTADEQKSWKSLEDLSVTTIPEGRRMFEGHEPLFDVTTSEDAYRRRSRKLIQRIISKEVARQKKKSFEFDVVSSYPYNASYQGTNRRGKFMSNSLNYTGLVDSDLNANGLGIQNTISDQYRGSFLNGKRHGEGIAKYNSNFGCVYIGTWANDTPHGVGNLKCNCGQYIGNWFHGIPNPNIPTTIVDTHSNCNVSWIPVNTSSSILEPVTFCDGKLLREIEVNNSTFKGSFIPKIKYSTTTCPMITIQQPKIAGNCTIETSKLKYEGQCLGSVATGYGVLHIPSLKSKLYIYANDSVISGLAYGMMRDKMFNGTLNTIHFNRVTDISGDGTLHNNTIRYTGGMSKGFPHGRVIATSAGGVGRYFGNFINGLPHGIISHEMQKNRRQVSNYRYGALHGETRLYKDGQLVKTIQYNFGNIVSEVVATSLQYDYFFIIGFIVSGIIFRRLVTRRT